MTDFWTKQRVLLTGAPGFLARHIWNGLHPRLEMGNLYTVTHLYSDLRDANTIRDELHKYDRYPTLVIHCAGNVGGIGKNRALPAELVYDNLLMNTHVLHEAYLAGVQKFIGIGSVCAYPKHTPTPFREYNLFNGYPEETNAPYGITKRALLVMGQAYRAQYGFNAIHLLLANLYGPGDHVDLQNAHVIPAIIRKMSEAQQRGEKHVTLWGSGDATREFLYVEDAAQAILRAAEVYDSPEPINIGTGQSVSIRHLAQMIAEIVGYTGGILWDTDMPDGQPKRELDVRRAALELGWHTTTELRDGLQKTVAWYQREVVNA